MAVLKRMLLVTCVLILVMQSYAYTQTTSGTVSSNETWSGTVTLTGDVIISSATVTISPGTIIKMSTSNDNIVNGTASRINIIVTGAGALVADGTVSQPITFTTTSLFPSEGAWGRIDIMGLSDGNTTSFKYCTFDYAQAPIEMRNPPGSSAYSVVSFENCLFTHSGASAIYFTSGGELNIIDCSFINCGKGVFVHGGSTTNITGCYFNTMSCAIINAGLVGVEEQTMTIDHCTIYDVDMTLAGTSPKWWDGYGIFNTTNGVSLTGALTITNSIIYQATLAGMTIGGWTVNRNNNCWDTGLTGLANIEGGAIGTGSMEQDPVFTDGANGDFSLQGGSPCLGTASDGTNIGAWQGGAANTKPVITSSADVTATEDTLYTYTVTATDSDSGDVVEFALTTSPAGMTIDSVTGVIQWTPDNGDVGNNSVVVAAFDNNGGTANQSYTLVVSNTNDGPAISTSPVTAAYEDSLYQYDVNATDVDAGDVLTYTLVSVVSGMTINSGSGIISWTPDYTQVGAESVEVKVTDVAGAYDTQKYAITVTAVNDAPQITSSVLDTVDEDSEFNFTVTATDEEGDSITFSLSNEPSGMIIDNRSGALLWIPDNDAVGAEVFSVTVDDGNGGSDTRIFTLTVINTNDAPAFTSSPVTVAAEDSMYGYDVDAADVDAGDSVTYSLVTSPVGMTINSITGVIAWSPVQADVGAESVVVKAADLHAGEVLQGFLLTVNPTNDAPVITTASLDSTDEDAEYSVTIEVQDDDGDSVTYSLTGAPAGMVIDSRSGSILWIPENDDVGDEIFSVQVNDGNGGTDARVYTLTVRNTNDAPVIMSVPDSVVQEDVAYVYDLVVNDVDLDDTLIYTVLVSPDGMEVSNSGRVTWIPGNTDIGFNNVIVTVADRAGVEDAQSFSVEVMHVNHAPQAPVILRPMTTMHLTDADSILWSCTDRDLMDTLSYQLEVSTTSNFSSLEILEYGLSDSAVMLGDLSQIGNLENNKVYYVRVIASDQVGAQSLYSPHKVFIYSDVNGIMNISAGEVGIARGKVELLNLNGQPANGDKPGIYIRREGGVNVKVLVVE